MKQVRAFSLKGEFERVVRAGELPEAERRRHQFKCLDPDCGAAFHLVKGHRRKENTEIVDPTFARNPGSRHRDGCHYDYDAIASLHKFQSFVKDGKFFLRINFPLGGKPTDRHPERGLSTAQRLAAANNTDKKPVASLAVLTDFLEQQFGSLHSDALENLALDYQGKSYAWNDVFTGLDHYDRLHREAAKSENDKNGLLIAVTPLRQIGRNEKGKLKFMCEAQNVVYANNTETIHPIIVLENDELAQQVEIGKTMLVATCPFLPEKVLNRPPQPGANLYVSLYVHSQSQMAAVESSALRKALLGPSAPMVQMPLFDTSTAKP